MAVPFNTHEVIQELQDLGFPTAQAEGLTAVLLKTASASQEQLATKLDVAEAKAEVKAELAALRTELKGDVAALRTDLQADIADLRTELQGDIATVRTDMATMRGELRAEIRDARNSMLTWTIGVLGTLYVLGFGLLYTLVQRGIKP
jgi:coiled-coil family 90 protein